MAESGQAALRQIIPRLKQAARRVADRLPPGIRRILLGAARSVQRFARGFFPAAPQLTRPAANAGPAGLQLPAGVHAEQPGRSEPHIRRSALEILSAAGTLTACSSHGSYFLGSGDLVAAHRLLSRRISGARDFATLQDMESVGKVIDAVFEDSSQYYRCEGCYRAFRIKWVDGDLPSRI